MKLHFYILAVAISAHLFCANAIAAEDINGYETVYTYTESLERTSVQINNDVTREESNIPVKKKPVPTYVPAQNNQSMVTGDNTITMPGDLSSTYETFLLAP